MLLAEIAATSAEVGSLSSRLAKVTRVAATLASAEPTDIRVIVAWLSGELPQRQIGVGWASLRSLPEPAGTATLTVAGVDATFTTIKDLAGRGSQARRAAQLAALFGAATAGEQQFLRRLLSGELRQGALAGVMVDAVAKAATIPVAAVRRAAMLAGDLPEVAAALLTGGESALAGFTLRVGRPVGPMLAQTASSVGDALDKLGGTALFETKLDGARVQVHRAGDRVSVYTRSLDDVTARLPEVVEATLALPVTTLIADAEAIALRPDGRPHRFQVTASRFGTRSGELGREPLSVFFFDLLHLDDTDLLDLPMTERLAALDRVIPPAQRMQRLLTTDSAAAQRFLSDTLSAGHEGVMAKDPAAGYAAGRRGAAWLILDPPMYRLVAGCRNEESAL